MERAFVSFRHGRASTGCKTGTVLIPDLSSHIQSFLFSDHLDKLLLETLLPLALLVIAQLFTWADRRSRRQIKSNSQHVFGYPLVLVHPEFTLAHTSRISNSKPTRNPTLATGCQCSSWSCQVSINMQYTRFAHHTIHN